MGERSSHTGCVYFASFGEICEGCFKGECVFLQPVEESGFAEYTYIGVLRGMDVGICSLVSDIPNNLDMAFT